MGVANWEYWHASEPLPYEPVGLIDYAIFADTQEEPKAVYEHLEWLEAKCARFFSVLKRTAGKLGDDLAKGEGVRNKGPALNGHYISIPAYTKEGITPRHCTTDYKVAVIDKTIRREILGLEPGERLKAEITQLLGLSYDETARIIRVKALKAGSPFEYRFPLFEMEMTRGSCQKWLATYYPDRSIPRSACVFCPYHSDAEFRAIREVSQDWERALEIDRAIRKISGAYVHRDRVPLAEADLDDSETRERKKGQEMFGFLQECEGMCGV